MEIVYDEAQLTDYVTRATGTDSEGILPAPVLVDRFLDQAIEIDVDALYDGTELYLGGVMEHIEEAGIHSGDSACVLPPVTLSDSMIARIRASTEAIADGVGVRGLINIQDRKSTRLNSSHVAISYAVFCLKTQKTTRS